MRTYQDFGRQNSIGEFRGNNRNENYSREEVGVGLGKDYFQGILIIEGTEVQAIVDQDQDQEQVQIETELTVTSVESMIILQKITLQLKKRHGANPANV